MSELFEEEEVLNETFDAEDSLIDQVKGKTIASASTARKRLEKMLEERRLREELEDLDDYAE